VSDRVRFQSGNFFEGTLPKADVIVIGHILHDWDLAQKKVLLGKAFDALPKGGAVIVYDAIIDDDRRENAFGLLMSLNMLIESPGGFDYTGADLSGVDARSWIFENARRTACWPGLDGDRIKVDHPSSGSPSRNDPNSGSCPRIERPLSEFPSL